MHYVSIESSQKNDLQDGKRCINRKSLSSNDITAAKTRNDGQSVGKKKDKRVFTVVDSIIKHLNGYVIRGKVGNCNFYVRPSHGAKVRCKVYVDLAMSTKSPTWDASISSIITSKD